MSFLAVYSITISIIAPVVFAIALAIPILGIDAENRRRFERAVDDCEKFQDAVENYEPMTTD